jgi:hypothetical protein
MAFEDLLGDTETDDLPVAAEELSPRHEMFCKNYVANGFNATQAYIAVGYSPNGAAQAASCLMSKNNVTARIKELTASTLKAADLTLENTLAQIAAVAQFDKRKLYNAEGGKIPIHLLDDKTAAALSHETKDDVVPFSKMSALEMSAKYLGAFEKDNSQRAPNLAIQVILE